MQLFEITNYRLVGNVNRDRIFRDFLCSLIYVIFFDSLICQVVTQEQQKKQIRDF